MNKVTLSIAKYTALEVMRNRILWLVLGAALIGIGLGLFGHTLAITESQQIQLSFMAASFRFFAIFIIALVVITTISRELNDKSMEMVLSLAITRSSYFFGKLAGFNMVILAVASIFGLCLLITAPVTTVFIWTFSLYCELLLILCFSLLCVLTVRQIPIAVIVVFGFYILARSIDAAVLMVDSPLIGINSLSNSMLALALHSIALLIPDLSVFTRTEWLIYGDVEWTVLTTIVLQTIVYFILLTGACLIDFYRKSV